MSAPKGTCKECGRENLTLPAYGLCGTCYDKKHPPATRSKHIRANVAQLLPVKKIIYIWETTDGTEFGNEVDALRHQIALNEKRKCRIEKKCVA